MEKFSLKWNDFHSNVSKSFGLFRSEEYLYDVRLMTEDYHEVSAHRLVLSACSEYFRNIFKNNKKQDTLIFLDGVTNEDLKHILDYIYLGEAQIFQDKLDRFLTIAKRLKLEGVFGQEQKILEPLAEKVVLKNIFTKNDCEKNIEKSAPKRLVKDESSRKIVKTFDNMADQSELDLIIKAYEEIVDSRNRRCTICDKIVFGCGPTNFRNHVEKNHFEGLIFDCPQCDKKFRSRNALNVHKTRCFK